jgi:large subunit ribosomal protein L31e
MAEKTKKLVEKPVKQEEKKSESAVEKAEKLANKEEKKPELEREYVIPLRKEVLKVQKYRKAKKAVKAIKEFLAKHMKVEDRDTRNVKVDRYLNEEVWFRGIRRPPTRIKVKAVKKDGIVYAELAEIPEAIKYKMVKDEKAHKPVEKKNIPKMDSPEHNVPEEEKSKSEVKDEKEKEAAAIELGKAQNKASANKAKHTAKGSHKEKTMPVRKTMKK